MTRNITILTTATALVAFAVPALGQTPATAPAVATSAAAPALAAGATIYDPTGAVVGTVESINAGAAVVVTGTTSAKVGVPITSFGTSPKGPTLAMTAAQLDAEAAKAAAAAKPAAPPKLAKGDTVSDTAGAPVGTIEEVTPDFAVVATAKNKARLPVKAFAAGEKGLVIGMTAAELDAAAEQAKAPAAK